MPETHEANEDDLANQLRIVAKKLRDTTAWLRWRAKKRGASDRESVLALVFAELAQTSLSRLARHLNPPQTRQTRKSRKRS